MEPEIMTLPSGYLHVRWHAECWAQLPPEFCAEVVPDEHIFNPDWNRRTVNEWWTTSRAPSREEG